jgi:hypothetical protein
MQKFYFDSSDGAIAHVDKVGANFIDRYRALAAATRTMGEMCRDYMPTEDGDGALQMTVRTTTGRVYELAVTFSVRSFD